MHATDPGRPRINRQHGLCGTQTGYSSIASRLYTINADAHAAPYTKTETLDPQPLTHYTRHVTPPPPPPPRPHNPQQPPPILLPIQVIEDQPRWGAQRNALQTQVRHLQLRPGAQAR